MKKKIMILAFWMLVVYFSAGGNSALAQPPHDRINDLDWSPNGRSIAVSYKSGLVEIVDLTNSQVLQLSNAYGFATDLMWSPDSNYLFIRTVGGYQIHIVDTHGTALYSKDTGDPNISYGNADWYSAGNRLAVVVIYGTGGGASTLVEVWDALTGAVLKTLDVQAGDIALSPTANLIAVGDGYYPQDLRIINSESGQIVDTFPADSVVQIEWSDDGNYLAIYRYGADSETRLIPQIEIWDFSAKLLLGTVTFGENDLLDFKWHPNSQMILVGTRGAGLSVWDWTSTHPLWQLNNSNELIVQALDWSSDGTKIAYGGEDGRLYISDMLLEPSPTSEP